MGEAGSVVGHRPLGWEFESVAKAGSTVGHRPLGQSSTPWPKLVAWLVTNLWDGSSTPDQV